jgi:hypothetical protein
MQDLVKANRPVSDQQVSEDSNVLEDLLLSLTEIVVCAGKNWGILSRVD